MQSFWDRLYILDIFKSITGRPVMSKEFSWFQDLFYKSPFASKCSWQKRSSHQGKKEVACIVSKPLVSHLWRWKLHIHGALSSRPKGDQRETQACYPFFRIFFLCQITPFTCDLYMYKHACYTNTGQMDWHICRTAHSTQYVISNRLWYCYQL